MTKHSNETFKYFCSSYNNLLFVGVVVLKRLVSFYNMSFEMERKGVIN